MDYQVSIKNERADFNEALTYLNRRHAFSTGRGAMPKLREFGFILLMAILIALLVVGLEILLPCWRLDLLSMLLVAVIFFVVLVVMLKRRSAMMAARLREDGAYLRPQTFTVTDEALLVETQVSSAVMRWPSIFGVKTTRTMLYIYVDGAMALFLPTRFFKDKEHLQKFVQAIREHIGQAPGQDGSQG